MFDFIMVFYHFVESIIEAIQGLVGQIRAENDANKQITRINIPHARGIFFCGK